MPCRFLASILRFLRQEESGAGPPNDVRPMEHSVFPTYETVRPWRTAAVVASLVAAVELVVILVAATIWLAKPLFASSAAAGQAEHADPAPPGPDESGAHQAEPGPDRRPRPERRWPRGRRRRDRRHGAGARLHGLERRQRTDHELPHERGHVPQGLPPGGGPARARPPRRPRRAALEDHSRGSPRRAARARRRRELGPSRRRRDSPRGGCDRARRREPRSPDPPYRRG